MVKLYRLVVVALSLALVACGGDFGAIIDDDDGSSPVPAQHRQPTEPEPEIPGGPGPTIPPATGGETASICFQCCIDAGLPFWMCNGESSFDYYDDIHDCWGDNACHWHGDCCPWVPAP
jgi:hypothetical protein